jgi:hypothetical protein
MSRLPSFGSPADAGDGRSELFQFARQTALANASDFPVKARVRLIAGLPGC